MSPFEWWQPGNGYAELKDLGFGALRGSSQNCCFPLLTGGQWQALAAVTLLAQCLLLAAVAVAQAPKC